MNNTITLHNQIVLTETSLEIIGELSNEQYMDTFHKLRDIEEKSKFYLGDLLNHLEANKKDILATIGESVGYNYRTLQNYKSICKRIPKDKRVIGVSFSHHIECLSATKNIDNMQQELILAKKNNRSVLQMRHDLREKLSDKTKTIVPEVIRDTNDVLYSESLNSILAIKRFLNNAFSKIESPQREYFLREFCELSDLLEGLL